MTLTRENQRLLGVHRFKMLLRVGGAILLGYSLIATLFLAGWGGSQGSFILFHFTFAAMILTGAGFGINAWVTYLGDDGYMSDNTLKVLGGVSCLVTTLFGAMFLVFSVLGVVGLMTW